MDYQKLEEECRQIPTSIKLTLQLDAEYREENIRQQMRKIAPKKMNPEGKAVAGTKCRP